VEWDEDEQAQVLALLDYESQLCSGCGGFLPDTTDADGRWTAGLPHRCLRCDAVQTKQHDYEKTTNPSALVVWPVERTN
jgi:hypothetical protein